MYCRHNGFLTQEKDIHIIMGYFYEDKAIATLCRVSICVYIVIYSTGREVHVKRERERERETKQREL